jgi:AcrR family transcriptional regulator
MRDAGDPDSSEGAEPRTSPRSPRGTRTRTSLVAAARSVFERDGYLASRVTDIADEAGVAHGTFYTYFGSKEEIFAAVLHELQEEMLHAGVRVAGGSEDPLGAIEAANRAYLESYRRNARLMAALDEASAVNERVRALRLERAAAFTERNAHGIRRLQKNGLVDPVLDADVAALAVSGMVSRVADLVFVQGVQVEFETLVWSLTRLWANALRLARPSEN